MDTETKINFGKRVAHFRDLKYLTQERLAELCGLAISSIASIESGKSFPKYDTLVKLIDVLGVEAHDLFYFDSYENIEEKQKEILNKFELIKNDQEKLQILYHFIKNLL